MIFAKKKKSKKDYTQASGRTKNPSSQIPIIKHVYYPPLAWNECNEPGQLTGTVMVACFVCPVVSGTVCVLVSFCCLCLLQTESFSHQFQANTVNVATSLSSVPVPMEVWVNTEMWEALSVSKPRPCLDTSKARLRKNAPVPALPLQLST